MGDIDHINQNPMDNRIKNLREVTHQQNHQNQKRKSNNVSGFTGVGWYKKANKWRSRIMVGKIEIHLGLFDNLEDAIKSRMDANLKYGFHPNHGMSYPCA